jgi:hypothetical protein
MVVMRAECMSRLSNVSNLSHIDLIISKANVATLVRQ